MSELLSVARRVASSGRSDEDVEVFVTHDRNFHVKTYDGEVEALSAAEPRGAGIRIVSGGRVGFAYTTDLTEGGLRDAERRARDNAAHASPDDAVGLAPPWTDTPAEPAGLEDLGQAAVSPDEKVQFALRLERATRSADPRVKNVEEAVYADSSTEIAIATSAGVEGSYRKTDAWCYAIAIAADGDDIEVGFEFALARGLGGMDEEDVARRAAERATGVLGATKIPSRPLPVIFDPYTSGQFLGVLGSALTAEAVQKGRSLFAGRLGEEVAGPQVTLVDDGTLATAPASAPWDGEGVPTRRTEVITGGTLTSFLYDLATARREGRPSTGNAGRGGFRAPPRPSPTNLAFDSTGHERDEVLRMSDEVLVVHDFHGVHSGANPVSGDFSVGATGRIYERGAPGRPVKEVTIAAPMVDILRRIEAIADDRRWLPFGGSYGGATTLVSEMTIAGE